LRTTTVLRVLLSVQDLAVRGFHFNATGLVVDVAPAWTIPRCGECGVKCRSIHDGRERRWRHHDLAGMTLHLRYRIQRAHCPDCGTVKTERVPWASHGSNFTYAFEERAAFLAQQCSKTAVVTLLRTAWRTVGTLIRRVVERAHGAHGDRLDGLRLIGVDELSYRRHHKYVTVVVDHERGHVVWAAEGKSAATLKRFFDELGPERCAQLEAVTIDLSGAYIKAVTEASPTATLIFDRFHVQRLAHDALDETRRDEVRKGQGRQGHSQGNPLGTAEEPVEPDRCRDPDARATRTNQPKSLPSSHAQGVPGSDPRRASDQRRSSENPAVDR
jgi:transposase